MSLITALLIVALAFLAGNVHQSEASCCCHCCKCCSCCTPCCNPPLLIKLPRTCPCCCKCCCPCCCCGGGNGRRKRRNVRMLWKRSVPFPQLQLPTFSGCQKWPMSASTPCNSCEQHTKAATKRDIVNLKDFMFPSLTKSD